VDVEFLTSTGTITQALPVNDTQLHHSNEDHRRLFMKRIRLFLVRIPFTLSMLAGLTIGAMLTNTYFEQITRHWLNRTGFAPNDLWYWHLERMVTSTVVTTGGRAFWEALIMVATAVGMAEWMVGWKRSAATFWIVHLLTLILLSLIMSLAGHQLRMIGFEADLAARDVGPSAGYFACLGLVSARLKRPWHWASAGLLLALLGAAMLIPTAASDSAKLKFSADLAHLLAFPLGWCSAWLVIPAQRRERQ
jgi:hypothetical protein